MHCEIEALDLGFFVDPELAKLLHHCGDDECQDPGPDGHNGYAECLDAKLAAHGHAFGKSISAKRDGDKERDQQRAERTADAMHRKHVQGIVDLQTLFYKLGDKVADNAAGQAEAKSPNRTNGSRSRRYGRETRDHACYSPDQACLAVADQLHHRPGDGTRGRRNMRHGHGQCGPTICGEGRAGIEAEPAHPQHGSTDHGHARIVRRLHFIGKATTWPQHHR